MREMPIRFDPAYADGRIHAQRRRLIWSLVSTVVGALVLAGIGIAIWLDRLSYQDAVVATLVWFFGIGTGLGVLRLIAYLLWLHRLRRARRRVGEGVALVLSHRGIDLGEDLLEWSQVEALAAVPDKIGYGHRLDLRPEGGERRSFPLEGLDALPGSIDAAARVYSSGRVGLDLSAYRG